MPEAALVVGLGNPGPKYAETRHNFGFRVLDELLRRTSVPSWQKKFSAEHARERICGALCTLLKPQTFMNLSGQPTVRAAQFFRHEVSSIIAVHDELDLSFGTVRIKKGGGTAGHKGLESLRQELGDGNFFRVRLGIGRPPHGNAADYVLERFTALEAALLPDIVSRGADAVEWLIGRGETAAMNEFNRREAPPEGTPQPA